MNMAPVSKINSKTQKKSQDKFRYTQLFVINLGWNYSRSLLLPKLVFNVAGYIFMNLQISNRCNEK